MFTSSRKAARAAQTPAAQLCSAQTKSVGVSAGLTPSSIVQMQRTFGNRATMQFIKSNAQTPVKPRTTGKTGIPDELKTGLEHLSGMDLSDVRVHRNSPDPARLNALAYAQGSDIHLGPGEETHLPHEAWHVVQQRQGRVTPYREMGGIAVNDDASLEQEADTMGARASAIGMEGASPSGKGTADGADKDEPVTVQAQVNGQATAQLMWNGLGNKKIESLADLNAELRLLGESQLTLAHFNGATPAAVDSFIAASDMNAYAVQDELAGAVADHFVNPTDCTLETHAGVKAWVNATKKSVTPKALNDLIDIANGDKTKIHLSTKMKGADINTPYVHDYGSNYICTFTMLGINWDGHPIIQVDLEGKVKNGLHDFS
ncbi:eCIS core domain-containing protein [Paenibacillus radicis (ex Gao et al. 2016)]|uniref:eCIS core domain-containing protein n=1 Tax=Paenibacillus radicis (ex Gao et al. 2016) TaxID=1737354 RepID=A0A917GUI9_9BACL|nr:DUF4157 domain-containing protein [Paenibacillus radicis (ex Gao et al. 2016)]GGG57776.1 hypothetical protein GCM10010918_08560 [Paenibacillus radicis (ex Gao et al. 2016)]